MYQFVGNRQPEKDLPQHPTAANWHSKMERYSPPMLEPSATSEFKHRSTTFFQIFYSYSSDVRTHRF